MHRVKIPRVIYYCSIGLLAMAPLPYVLPAGITALIILLLMYIIMAQGWNLLGGYLGDISFGHVAFFGLGAYMVAMLVYYDVSFFQPVNVLFGGIVALGLAAVIGYPFLRLKGFYFAIGTLGLAEMIRLIFKNSTFALGAKGILLPTPSPYSIQPYYYAILGLTLAVILIIYRIVNSKLGLAFVAIRDDPDAARMVGVNVTGYRILGFAISAFIVGLAGGFYAYFNLYIHPDGVFSLALTFEMLVMVFLGGVGTLSGPIIGAVVVLLVEEVGRATIRQGFLFLLAIMLVAVFIFMPGGIVGTLTKQTPFMNPLNQLRRKRRDHT